MIWYDTTTTYYATNTRNMTTKMGPRLLTIRLHLVRHGETYANREGIVLGQRESALTAQGIAQALALGERWTSTTTNTKQPHTTGVPQLWRVYSSDYARTQQTAALILRGGATYDEASQFRAALTATIVPDNRLKERAKGVKEGRKKTMPYDEALQLHQHEHGTSSAKLPLLESELDVWTRIQAWLEEVIEEASALQTGTSSFARHAQKLHPAGVYEILAVSHSATIRTIVNRLVGDQLPSTVVRGSGDHEGSQAGMLTVPNTSRTIIDVAIGRRDDPNNDDDDNNTTTNNNIAKQPPIQQLGATLIELTNTDHLL